MESKYLIRKQSHIRTRVLEYQVLEYGCTMVLEYLGTRVLKQCTVAAVPGYILRYYNSSIISIDILYRYYRYSYDHSTTIHNTSHHQHDPMHHMTRQSKHVRTGLLVENVSVTAITVQNAMTESFRVCGYPKQKQYPVFSYVSNTSEVLPRLSIVREEVS